jgi:hypothetical protein
MFWVLSQGVQPATIMGMVLKGNTLASVDPPVKFYRLYQRDQYRTNQVRWHKVKRFVSEEQIAWCAAHRALCKLAQTPVPWVLRFSPRDSHPATHSRRLAQTPKYRGLRQPGLGKLWKNVQALDQRGLDWLPGIIIMCMIYLAHY